MSAPKRAARQAEPKPPARVPRGVPQEVRIVGGQWKRSKISVARVPGLRPTPDRVRETLFNWLGQTLEGWRCLDAFAGTGALGFEAASRGAAAVTVLEREAVLVSHLRALKERLKADAVRVEPADAMAWMARAPAEAFELVFLDPPFDTELFLPALRLAARLVPPGGLIYLEADRPLDDEIMANLGDTLRVHRRGRAGAVHFHLIQRLLGG